MIMHIARLVADVSLGVYEWEKQQKQKIVVNLHINYDGARAAHSDRLEDALDYDGIEKRVLEVVQDKHYNLLENMVNSVGMAVLEFSRVKDVRVEIGKPGALKNSETVSIEEWFKR